MKIVLIEWVDSSAHYGWCDPDDVDMTPALIHSVGFLAKEGKDSVSLVSGHGPCNWDHVMTIPKGCIKKITPLRARGGEAVTYTGGNI